MIRRLVLPVSAVLLFAAACSDTPGAGIGTPTPTPDAEPDPSTDDGTTPSPDAGGEPDGAATEPDAATPQPDAANPEPDAANPEPDAAKPEPDSATPQPDAANPEPDAANPEPDAANPEPDAADPEPDVPVVQCETNADCAAVIKLSDPCLMAVCDQVDGFCAVVKSPAPTACDDGVACTANDQCGTGVCQGTWDESQKGCEISCSDEVDNDQDGETDCDDDACASATACIVGEGSTCASPFVVSLDESGVFSHAGTTTGAGNDLSLPTDACPDYDAPETKKIGGKGSGSQDVVYTFTPAKPGTYTFSLAAGDAYTDHTLSLWTSPCPLTGSGATCIVADDELFSKGDEFLSAPLEAGVEVFLVIDGYGNVGIDVHGPYLLTVKSLPKTEAGGCTNGWDDDLDGLGDCFDADCFSDDACPAPIAVGSFAVTEVLGNPNSTGGDLGGVSEQQGEWIEIVNTTGKALSLDGLGLDYRSWEKDETEPALPTEGYLLKTDAEVPAGSLALLLRTVEPNGNGGLTGLEAASYGSIGLSNTKNVSLRLVSPPWDGKTDPPAGQVVDKIVIAAGTFSNAQDGVAWQLDPGAVTSADAALANDSDLNWCPIPKDEANLYTALNYGTPAAPNAPCPDEPKDLPGYAADVQPILGTKCAGCHTDGAGSGGHNLGDTYEDAFKPAVNPVCEGLVKGECVLVRVGEGHMPLGAGCGGPVPDGSEMASFCVTQSEYAVLQGWVDGGMLP